MKLSIDYKIDDKNWLKYIKKGSIVPSINSIFASIADTLKLNLERNNTIEISITFTNDKNIQQLNKDYRDKDQPTNVLSFPMFENEFFKQYKKMQYVPLGDIVLSLETILRESEEQNKTFNDHLTHLVIHSILHLLGYDHIEKEDERIMEELEIKILDKFGIKNPYV